MILRMVVGVKRLNVWTFATFRMGGFDYSISGARLLVRGRTGLSL